MWSGEKWEVGDEGGLVGVLVEVMRVKGLG